MVPRVFAADAVELAYGEGPEAGPPLVLLHGVVRRHQDFEPILPPLAARAQVYAVDFRGHGASGRTPGGYRVVDYADDIVDFLERQIAAPCVVYGHSLGGMVAALVASRLPGLVRGAIFEDPPFEMMGRRIGETSYAGLFRAYRDLTLSTDSEESLAAALAEVPVQAPGQPRPARLGDQRDTASLRQLASCLRQFDPEVLDPVIRGRWLDGYDVEGSLRSVRCPGLFLQADDSAGGVLPDEYAAGLVACMPRARLVRMAGVGHNIHLTQPEATARLACEFLEELG